MKGDNMLENIPALVKEKLNGYQDLSFLEQVAMFIGKAQILEEGLKNVLEIRFGVNRENIENFSLGQVKTRLTEVGVRPDFIGYLESLIELRNYITHELLRNEALLSSITGGETGRLERRNLEKGIYELEQLIIIFDWQEDNDAWET